MQSFKKNIYIYIPLHQLTTKKLPSKFIISLNPRMGVERFYSNFLLIKNNTYRFLCCNHFDFSLQVPSAVIKFETEGLDSPYEYLTCERLNQYFNEIKGQFVSCLWKNINQQSMF